MLLYFSSCSLRVFSDSGINAIIFFFFTAVVFRLVFLNFLFFISIPFVATVHDSAADVPYLPVLGVVY